MMFSVRGGSCWGEGLLPDYVGMKVVSLSERADSSRALTAAEFSVSGDIEQAE